MDTMVLQLMEGPMYTTNPIDYALFFFFYQTPSSTTVRLGWEADTDYGALDPSIRQGDMRYFLKSTCEMKLIDMGKNISEMTWAFPLFRPEALNNFKIDVEFAKTIYAYSQISLKEPLLILIAAN